MKIHKDIEDVKFNSNGVSEHIVMASAAGWYVGQVCKDPSIGDWFVGPYDRHTGYHATPEEADILLEAFEKDETPEPTGPWATQDDYI